MKRGFAAEKYNGVNWNRQELIIGKLTHLEMAPSSGEG